MSAATHRDSRSQALCSADCPLRSSVFEEVPERGCLSMWRMVVAVAQDWRLGSGVFEWETGAG